MSETKEGGRRTGIIRGGKHVRGQRGREDIEQQQ
jgi:hypothetical protein